MHLNYSFYSPSSKRAQNTASTAFTAFTAHLANLQVPNGYFEIIETEIGDQTPWSKTELCQGWCNFAPSTPRPG